MKRLDISDQTAISMPMKNLIAIVAAVAVGVWAYFGVTEYGIQNQISKR